MYLNLFTVHLIMFIMCGQCMNTMSDVNGWTTDEVASWLQKSSLTTLVDRFSGKVKTYCCLA